jgi:hypothetical protein
MKLSLIALSLALFGTSNALRVSKETHEACTNVGFAKYCDWEARKINQHDYA